MKETITLKDVYTIAERPQGSPEGKDRWTKIGIGFVNRDNSINVVLDAIPLNGRLQIRDRKAFQKTQQPSE
jgi:hypothetical protein